MVADSLERQSGGTWQLEALSNICPACFDISPGEDNTIAISIDGNQQHIRFKDKSPYEYEKLSPKLFVDYGCRRFDLAGSTAQQAGCGNNFKATSGWNKAEAVAQSKKALDETGLMAATCFHGTNLRFMNVYGGNERYSHVIRLLESIEADCPAAGQIQLCYDVACAFEPSLHRHDATWVDRVQVSTGANLTG
jgi:Kyakuja-Dileera-Zisupton transposase